MYSKLKGKAPIPRGSSIKSSREEVIALSLACLHERAEQLAALAQSQDGLGKYVLLHPAIKP